MARFEVHRLERGASFQSTDFTSRRSFDAVLIDTQARRPVEREVCVAPYVVAMVLADKLNDYGVNLDV